MDKSKAIELLKQALTDIPKLKKLHYNNQEFKLWCARVETIIKKGLDAEDYERLDFVQSKYFPDELDLDHLSLEEDYLPKLNDYETALKSIIQKYEILEIAREGNKGSEVKKMVNETRLDELNRLRHELWEFSDAVRRYAGSETLTEEQKRRGAELYNILSKKVGYLGTLISELSGISKVNLQGKEYDMWLIALKMPADKLADNALGVCLQATNRAIGKLEDDIRTGKRDAQTGDILDKSDVSKSEPPKAFVAHGGRSGVLDKLREFIEALGIKPIIVELSASKGMTVDEKVSKYIKDADFGIVLATKGGIIDTKGKETKQHPRLNVIDELERLRAAFPDKTILLLEKGVDLPSNISGLTHEPFVGQSMDRAFTAIARELVEFGILRATKPQE